MLVWLISSFPRKYFITQNWHLKSLFMIRMYDLVPIYRHYKQVLKEEKSPVLSVKRAKTKTSWLKLQSRHSWKFHWSWHIFNEFMLKWLVSYSESRIDKKSILNASHSSHGLMWHTCRVFKARFITTAVHDDRADVVFLPRPLPGAIILTSRSALRDPLSITTTPLSLCKGLLER